MRESEVLSRLEGAGLAAPRLVAADVDGEGCGDPALLMTRLRGRIELSPHDPTDWLGQMAEVLVRIHESDVVLADFERFIDPSTLEVPGWAARPSLWAEAIEILADEPSGGRRCLIHHDFQQFNLLWLRGKLAGVVDWVWAGHGPPDVDVAHCRLNLTVLYSHSRAEEFRLLYEARADRRIDPWWDLAGLLAYLPGWGPFLQQQAGPRMRVDFGGMHARVEEALAAILARS
jgi:aminoglycoside phosphotransferase (APT) family kinase protein